jgi:hypothetical protein
VSKSRRLLTLCAACCAAVLLFASTAQAHGLKVGFADPLLASEEAGTRQLWLGHAGESGGSVVRINVLWANVAPKQPGPTFDAANPADPEYHWTTLDAAVREASAAGFEVLLTVYDAPTWAEGAGRPKQAEPGSWKPSPGAFGEFAHALARRYDGSFPDPADPADTLPAVSDFEAWNEPNLDVYLAPQWEGESSNPGPGLYRPLLNHFFAAVKSVQPGATVLGGSLAPFGDEPGGERTRPVLFLRTLLCLKGGKLVPVACPEPAHFDVLSDHPIAVGPPDQSAVSPLDVTTPDIGRLTRVLAKAEKAKTVQPAGHKGLWVTEFWYDTDPPDPSGVSLALQARWYQQDLYLFWKQGARVAIALQLRDSPAGKGYAFTYQSGLYFLDGKPKPSQKALRFPFVVHRTDSFHVEAWGIAPQPGKVRIQVLRKKTWKTLATVDSGGLAKPFSSTVRLYRFGKLRAVEGKAKSLPWVQR